MIKIYVVYDKLMILFFLLSTLSRKIAYFVRQAFQIAWYFATSTQCPAIYSE